MEHETLEIRLRPEAKECMARLSDQLAELKKTLNKLSTLEQLFDFVQFPVEVRDVLSNVISGKRDSFPTT